MKPIIVLPVFLAILVILSCNSSAPKKSCDKYLGTWHDRKQNNPGDTLAEPGTLTVKEAEGIFKLEFVKPGSFPVIASCTCDHGRLISGNDLIPMEGGKIYFKTRFFSKE